MYNVPQFQGHRISKIYINPYPLPMLVFVPKMSSANYVCRIFSNAHMNNLAIRRQTLCDQTAPDLDPFCLSIKATKVYKQMREQTTIVLDGGEKGKRQIFVYQMMCSYHKVFLMSADHNLYSHVK